MSKRAFLRLSRSFEQVGASFIHTSLLTDGTVDAGATQMVIRRRLAPSRAGEGRADQAPCGTRNNVALRCVDRNQNQDVSGGGSSAVRRMQVPSLHTSGGAVLVDEHGRFAPMLGRGQTVERAASARIPHHLVACRPG